MSWSDLPPWLQEILPIGLLVTAVTVVIRRLPRIDVGHSDDFRMRRIRNWMPLGLTYAFLYMARYNLKVSKFAFEELQDSSGGALISTEFLRPTRLEPGGM